MKDSERLDLLKEIGGTRVYEERRRESLKIMQETGKYPCWLSWFLHKFFVFLHIFLFLKSGNKRNQIIQVVQYLDERLRELDEEKAELKKYQQLDKQRKSLEYTIYDKELHDARQKVVEVSHYSSDWKEVLPIIKICLLLLLQSLRERACVLLLWVFSYFPLLSSCLKC